MKVVRIDGDDGVVETGGLRRKANLSLIKGLKAGDYVILHAGFAIEKLKTGEAKKTLKLLRSI